MLILSESEAGSTLQPHDANLIQTEQATKAGIAVQKYGALLIPSSATSTNLVLEADVRGHKYKAQASAFINANKNVGDTVILQKV